MKLTAPPALRRLLAALLLAAILGPPVTPAGAGAPSTSGAFALYARGDYEAAAAELTPLAWAGDPRAQGLLGFLYEYGKGVPQNYVAAANWYASAAEQGEATAQYLLGLLYDKGHGVPRDVVLSQKWLILATARASRRERDVYTRLRNAVATKMSPAQLATAQRLAIEWAPVRGLPVQ
ncbi:tetratricopeptide repeat protein [Xanthobacter versatilis]|uniref:Sel1 domain protein repeat-containing protein n=1 Tax=Xanthobacter autotrophicus (strain ATCC BAA-1158 / Py2) TaxID=78245 RepID=A7IH55_XANP2|nr:Sel1 domain protein repeat-containing protein [Xanthobacter autotrophicus Py2]